MAACAIREGEERDIRRANRKRLAPPALLRPEVGVGRVGGGRKGAARADRAAGVVALSRRLDSRLRGNDGKCG